MKENTRGMPRPRPGDEGEEIGVVRIREMWAREITIETDDGDEVIDVERTIRAPGCIAPMVVVDRRPTIAPGQLRLLPEGEEVEP